MKSADPKIWYNLLDNEKSLIKNGNQNSWFVFQNYIAFYVSIIYLFYLHNLLKTSIEKKHSENETESASTSNNTISVCLESCLLFILANLWVKSLYLN